MAVPMATIAILESGDRLARDECHRRYCGRPDIKKAEVVDIARQLPAALNHQRMDKRSQVVHDVRLTDQSLLAKITGRQTLGVNSTHHQAVARVASPLQITAWSTDGVIEGLELKPEAASSLPFLLTVQFHPERLVDRYAEHQAIFRAFTGACVLHSMKKL